MAEKLSLVKKVNRRIVLPARRGLTQARLYPYYFLRTRPVTTHFLNRTSDAVYQKAGRPLSSLEQKITNTLEQDGFAVTHLDDLLPNRALFPELLHYTEALLERAHEGRKKKFLEYGWPEHRQPVAFDNILMCLTLEPTVLAIAAAYLGTAPKLKFFSCNRTVPVEAGSEAQGSQRWHRDPGAGRILKLFLYLSDVDEAAGPFTYIAGSQQGGRSGHLFKSHIFGRYGAYPPEGGVETSTPKDALKIGTGKAGTIIFCDTLGLHRGGYATSRERLMYTALFESPAAFGRSTLVLPEPQDIQEHFIHPLARFALLP
jgi:hypothetical protein